MSYPYYRRPLGHTALGAASCIDNAYESVKNGQYDLETAEGRELLAKEIANCSAVAVCTAYGAAAASELCGMVGEFVAEVLIDVLNEIADAVSKFWGGGSDERKKRRRAMMAAANKSYEDLQQLIWDQWYLSLESTVTLYEKLFKKKQSLEFYMWLFSKHIPLDKISGTNQFKPKYLGDPPKCYPGPGCITTSSEAGYVFIPPGGHCAKPPSSNLPTDLPGFKGMGSVYGPSYGSRYTEPACPADKLSAFFYIKDNIEKMADYVEEIVKAQIYVGVELTDQLAREIAKEEAAKKDAASAKRRAQFVATMKKYRERRARERAERNMWTTLLAQGTWGMLWRPVVK